MFLPNMMRGKKRQPFTAKRQLLFGITFGLPINTFENKRKTQDVNEEMIGVGVMGGGVK